MFFLTNHHIHTSLACQAVKTRVSDIFIITYSVVDRDICLDLRGSTIFGTFLLKPWLSENIDARKYVDIMENTVQNGFSLNRMLCCRNETRRRLFYEWVNHADNELCF